MLQPRFWHLLFWGLLSSFIVYNVHFSPNKAIPGSINSSTDLEPLAGKQHVLVTSGAGFFGSHLALALLEQGHAVTLVDDLQSRPSISHLYRLLGGTSTRLKVLSCNLGSSQQLADVLAAEQPQIVVHLSDHAAESLSDANPLEYLANSSSHVLSLLKAMDSSNTVSKLVVSSHYAVYGSSSSATPLAEDTACCQPASAKGHAALFTEGAVNAYAASKPDFSAVILRHGSIMGADPQARLGQITWATTSTGQPGDDALSRCLAAAATSAATAAAQQGGQQQQQQQGLHEPQQQFELIIPGSGKQLARSCFKEYVHVADLAAGFLAAMDRASNPPAVYNVGTGTSYSYLEVWTACNKLFGVQPQQVSAQVLSSGACEGIVGNVSKLTTHTGWSPKYQLEDALMHALQWQQSAAARMQ